MKKLVLLAALAVPVAGCSNMSTTEQRALSGTAIGAGTGALVGAIAGNTGLGLVVGAGAGLAGGLIYDSVKKNEAASYRRGYHAGQNNQPPKPPQ